MEREGRRRGREDCDGVRWGEVAKGSVIDAPRLKVAVELPEDLLPEMWTSGKKSYEEWTTIRGSLIEFVNAECGRSDVDDQLECCWVGGCNKNGIN